MAPAQISDGVFQANDLNTTAAKTMLDEMALWTDALMGLRATRK